MFKGMKGKIAAGLAATGAFVVTSASAANIDTAAIQSAITSAEADALTTGEYVIGTVASLVVVGLIIGLVRKL